MNTTTYRASAQLDRLIRDQGRLRRWVAAQVGLSPWAMSRLLSGRRRVDHATAERISQLLDTDLFFAFDVHERADSERVSTSKEGSNAA